MKRVLIIALLFGVYSCSDLSKDQAGQSYTIHGNVHSMTSGQVFLIKEDGGVGKILDSAAVDASGNFELKGKVEEPGLYTLDLNGQLVGIVLDTSEIKVTAEGKPEGKQIVKGSRGQQYWEAYDHTLFDYRLRMALLKKSSLMPEEKEKKATEYYQSYANKTKSLIKASGSSFLTLILASKLDVERDFPLLDSLYKVFTQKSPGSSYTVNFRNSLNKVRCTIVGQPICDISLTDNKGVLSNLSDYKGNYVLLDFWASWCGPCRKENPELVKVYNKYHDKGFEIYSVSIDEVKEAWLGAIKEDNLTWKQVSDLKGWEGSTAVQYNLEAIPSNFLLDKEGKILYKNLDAKQLDLLLNKLIK